MASDIHLSAQTPATNHAFLEFLDCAAAQSDALFLLGDIFDVWIGDDLALRDPPAWLVPVLDGLSNAARCIPLYVGRGNRDFLMGHALMNRIGAHLLPDQIRVHTDIGPVLLSHGDEYCTADRHYQRFRRLVRCQGIQKMFLTLPLSARRSVAAWARRRSQQKNECKPMTIMDVDPDAIDAAIRHSDCRILVHGHTHRPAIHDFMVDEHPCQRVVLPDWDCDHGRVQRGGWLVLDNQGPTLQAWPGTPVPAG